MKEFEPRTKHFKAINLKDGTVKDMVLPADFTWSGLKFLGFEENEDWVWLESTGLADKDEIEIFEGDVLHILGADPIVVQYIEGAWDKHYLYDQTKVIGNVFSNPEILNQYEDKVRTQETDLS